MDLEARRAEYLRLAISRATELANRHREPVHVVDTGIWACYDAETGEFRGPFGLRDTSELATTLSTSDTVVHTATPQT